VLAKKYMSEKKIPGMMICGNAHAKWRGTGRTCYQDKKEGARPEVAKRAYDAQGDALEGRERRALRPAKFRGSAALS
jgi:hypothetical protein